MREPWGGGGGRKRDLMGQGARERAGTLDINPKVSHQDHRGQFLSFRG